MPDETMIDGQEAQWGGWVAAVTGIIGMIGGFLAKSWGAAKSEGAADGELRAWRQSIEAMLRAGDVQRDAVEARINLRMLAIEARKDRIDDRLGVVPTRTEMQEGLDRISREVNQCVQTVNDLSRFMHRNRPDAAE